EIGRESESVSQPGYDEQDLEPIFTIAIPREFFATVSCVSAERPVKEGSPHRQIALNSNDSHRGFTKLWSHEPIKVKRVGSPQKKDTESFGNHGSFRGKKKEYPHEARAHETLCARLGGAGPGLGVSRGSKCASAFHARGRRPQRIDRYHRWHHCSGLQLPGRTG